MSNVSVLRLPDAKRELIDKVGDVGALSIFNTQVLVAKYVRPEKTKGGVLLTQNTRQEDVWQGKVGLIVALGHMAFRDATGEWFPPESGVTLHDWVLYRASDGLDMKVNGVDCKLLTDTAIKGRVSDPDMIW